MVNVCLSLFKAVNVIFIHEKQRSVTFLLMKKIVENNNLSACPLTNLFEGTCTPRGWILGVQGIF